MELKQLAGSPALRRQRLGVVSDLHGRRAGQGDPIATTRHVGRLEGSRGARDLAAGLPLPPRFGEACRRRVTAYMSRDYADQRMAGSRRHSPASRSI